MRLLTIAALSLVALEVEARQTPGTLNFADVTASRVQTVLPYVNGPNMKDVATGDFDLDGDPDIALAIAAGTFGSRRNKVYRNDGGVFVDITGDGILPEMALFEVSRVAAFGDFTGDGWPDLVLVNDSFEFGDPIRLFVNQHPGGVFSHFLEEGQARGLGADWACGAFARDVDGAQGLDVYSANYGSLGQDELYLNDGSGFFTVATPTHVPGETDFSIDAAGADINGDGTLDALISNDGAPFFVYYNNLQGLGSGTGDFQFGVGGDGGVQSLGTSNGHGSLEPADFDGDGDVDIYWTNRNGASEDVVLRNDGNDASGMATFTEVQMPLYVRTAISVKSVVRDLNDDGRVDIVVTTSTRPAILRNTSVPGTLSFVDWTPANSFPFGTTLGGMSSTLIDSNTDGDLDVFVGASSGDYLFEQVPTPEHTEASLPSGDLPDFVDQDPIAVLGSAAQGETDVWSIGDFGDGFVSVVLRGDDDLLLEVLRDGVVQATSDRGAAGVEEALQVATDDAAWSVRVTSQLAAGTGEYVLELLGRVEGVSSDSCGNAEVVTPGGTPFTNIGATTDGPAHSACFDFNEDNVPSDVWFEYQATATGTLTVSTCGTANFDTKVMVYEGRECPVTEARIVGCNEDTVGCANFTSIVTLPVTHGRWYKIRVGGWMGAQGTGVLELTLAEDALPTLCFGDGGDQEGCTPCPCGNDAAPGSSGGCLNGAGTSGVLTASGVPSEGADTLRIVASDLNPSTFGVLVSGDNALPISGSCLPGTGVSGSLLDGLRCVGGGVLRHGARASDTSGEIGQRTPGWGTPDGPVGGILAQGGFTLGYTRRFQIFYREDGMLGCGMGQNTTNAVSATVVP